MIWTYSLLLILHIIICVVTFVFIACEILDVHKYMFYVVLFLPFWGVLIVLILHFQVAFDADGSREIGVEKLRIDSELYKSVNVDIKKNSDSIIPMEEALIINSAGERRQLIMDVLNDNPKEYIEFLQKAGNNDDTEVVHYAVTAMVEISKENDYELQKLERSYSADPDNFEVLTKYSDFLWKCLEQNLMQGQVETMNRNYFSELVRKKLSKENDFTDYIRLIKNSFRLKNYTEAGEAIKKASELWKDNEDILMLKIQYYASLGRGDELKALLDELESNKVYLSARAKEAIAFWKS